MQTALWGYRLCFNMKRQCAECRTIQTFCCGSSKCHNMERFFFCGGGFNTHSSFPNFPPDNLLNFFREEPFFFFMLGLKTDLGAF